jgi:preprotein translocase subunit SecY
MNSNNFNIPLERFAEIKNKIIFTLLCLIVYRFGSYISLPGVNTVAMNKIVEANSTGILGVFNMLSGGSLGRMSIFALAIMPYITSSIIMQLLSFLSKDISFFKKEGVSGKRKLNLYTKVLTIFLAAMQGYGVVASLNKLSMTYGNVIIIPLSVFKLISITTLVTGTMFLMWLGDQITKRGIGNGISLIIFSGIVSGMPRAVAATLELARNQVYSIFFIISLLAAIVLMIAFIIFFERAYRKLSIQYPRRQQGNKVLGGELSHMPLKLNTPGVIPPIFANSLLLFPLTILNFTGSSEGFLAQFINTNLAHGRPLYLILYVCLIVFFDFFYTSVVFNAEETAENLRKYGAFLPGIKPGAQTVKHLDYILTRITVLGAAYISFVCILPEFLIAKYSIPFYLGGTGVLIVVNVIMDTTTQIQSQLVSFQYEKLIKKANLKRSK